MNACTDRFDELAEDQRCGDFEVVRAWVFAQIEHNLPQFARELACLLAGAPGPYPKGYDYRVADAEAIGALRDRLHDAVAEQDETFRLGELLREEAEEEAEEAKREAAKESSYWDACDRAIPNIPCW